jgi:hypothetical protein
MSAKNIGLVAGAHGVSGKAAKGSEWHPKP